MPDVPTSNPDQFYQGAPLFLVPDVSATADFYRGILGFKADPGTDTPEYSVLWRDNAAVHLAKGERAPTELQRDLTHLAGFEPHLAKCLQLVHRSVDRRFRVLGQPACARKRVSEPEPMVQREWVPVAECLSAERGEARNARSQRAPQEWPD